MRITVTQLRTWLFGLFLFLLPWQTRWIFRTAEIGGAPWEYGTLALYATEVLLWVIVLLGWKDFIRGFLRIGVWGWVVGVGVLLPFISMAWAPEPSVAFFAALHILEAVLLVFVIMSVPRNTLIILGGAFVSGAVFQSLLAVFQIAMQWVYPSTLLGIALHDPIVPGTSVVETAGGRFLRAYGGLPHPNILGGYLAAAMFFVIALASDIKNRASWIVLLAGSAVLMSALFLTFSRSAWIAAVVGVLGAVFLVMSRGRENPTRPVLRFRTASLALLAIVILTICGFAFSDVLAARFGGSGRLEIISFEERSRGISDALVLVKEHPFFGFGIGASTLALEKKWPGRPAWVYQPVHNVFILVVVELGVLGLAAILTLLIGLWRVILHRWRQSTPEDRFRLAALYGAALGILVIALFDHYPWSLYSGNMLVAVIIGFLLNQAEKTP